MSDFIEKMKRLKEANLARQSGVSVPTGGSVADSGARPVEHASIPPADGGRAGGDAGDRGAVLGDAGPRGDVELRPDLRDVAGGAGREAPGLVAGGEEFDESVRVVDGGSEAGEGG